MKDADYLTKYGKYAKSLGFTEEALAAFNTRLKISVEKLWTTPPEPE